VTGDHEEPIDRLRGICMALPEATERLSHGVPYADHHHDDRVAFRCGAPEGFQRMLVEATPGRFLVPPYVGHRGWPGVYLDVPVDWDEIRAIVEGAYRAVAPRRLVARLDEART
jgi:hypothetical protein